MSTRRRLWRLGFLLCLLASAACFVLAARRVAASRSAEAAYAALRADVSQQDDAAAEAPAPTAGPTLEEVLAAPFEGIVDADETKLPADLYTGLTDSPIDFDRLRALNPELIAWITIPGTQIDYPVARHEGDDQTYYLSRDLYGSPQFAGCIFMQDVNAADFSDPVTVLYGHNMTNGSMFQNLYFYLTEPDFLKTSPFVTVRTAERVLVYEVISAYCADDLNLMLTRDFTDPDVFSAYLDECLHPRSLEAVVRDGVFLDADARLLTLSTCRAGRPDTRLLVQAVLVYEKEVSDP